MKKKRIFLILISILLTATVLRFYGLEKFPPGLYWDETSIGYNAYSVLETGKDEYSKIFPLIFKAYGEYKLPVYIYITSLSINIFGLSEFAVRFPSAFAGAISILFLFLFTKKLFEKQKNRYQIALISSFFFAISPWHIHFSRAGFEANLALALMLIASTLFIYSAQSGIIGLYLSVVLFSASSATYNSARIFAPLILASLVIIYKNQLFKRKRRLLIAFLIGLITVLPFIPQLTSGEALIRAQSESIFNREKPLTQFFSNYLANFDTTFLFFRGDQNGRHSVRKLGMLYVFELPLIIFAIYGLKSQLKDKRGKAVLLSWLLLAPIPSSLTTINPHALRSLHIIPAWHILSAIGLVTFALELKKRKAKLMPLAYLAVILVISYNILLYLHQYYVHYPRETALDWQNGVKETIGIIADQYDIYEEIFVSDTLSPINTAFYLPVKPEEYQKADTEKQIGKIKFFKYAWEIQKTSKKPVLIIAPWWQKPGEETSYQEVKMINGDTLFNIWEE